MSTDSIFALVARATDFSDFEQPGGSENPRRWPLALVHNAEPTSPPPAIEPAGASRWGWMNGVFESNGRGVQFIEEDKEGHHKETCVCSQLHVRALTRDGASNLWGRLLCWPDEDGKEHRWAMPAALLQGDGVDLRKELAAGGVRIAPSARARSLLIAYLQTAPVRARWRCVDSIGWHHDTYLSASAGYGPQADSIVYQSDAVLYADSSAHGEFGAWKESVARLCAGNSRLVLALSAAFAAPLLALANVEGGGLHFVGHSSTGKTTALRAAASVWGDPVRYVRTWRATANGLEAIAAQHNDGLLILDELHQCEPREAGEIAYLLGNGQGKARASRVGAARRSQNWRVLYLSSGEHGLDARLSEIGKRSTAGQEVRLPSVPADAGEGMGIVECLHEFESAREFVHALDRAAITAHGSAGPKWLELLVRDRVELINTLPDGLESYIRSLAKGQVLGGQAARVARRFAICALAGDLATRFGLTGWSEGQALEAVGKCFDAWLRGGGGADHERVRLLAQVRGFIEKHGESRFASASSSDAGGCVTRDRVGFKRRTEGGGMQWLVLPEAWRSELVRGFDPAWAARELVREGWLMAGKDRPSRTMRIPGEPEPLRVYTLTSRVLSTSPGGDADRG